MRRGRFARLTFRPAVVLAVVVVFAAAAAAGGTLLYVRHRPPHAAAERNSSQSTRTTPAGQGGGTVPGQASSAPAPSSPGPSASPSSAGSVTVTAVASQHPEASSVATFLNQYFAAINAHDYQSYMSLRSAQAQQGLTAAGFSKGYGSTVDSAETLVSISTAANGDLAAAVTFTSHQNPADSPDQKESCTDWNVSLYLTQGGLGYLIDNPPPGYKASYQACP